MFWVSGFSDRRFSEHEIQKKRREALFASRAPGLQFILRFIEVAACSSVLFNSKASRAPIQHYCLRFGIYAACSSVLLFGAGNRNRTYDLIITNDALYQLSYSGAGGDFKGLTGVGQFKTSQEGF